MLQHIKEEEIYQAVNALCMAQKFAMLDEVVEGSIEKCQQEKNIRGMARTAIALNWTCWKYFEDGDQETAKRFEKWWKKAEDIIYTSGVFTKEEQAFYARESD